MSKVEDASDVTVWAWGMLAWVIFMGLMSKYC